MFEAALLEKCAGLYEWFKLNSKIFKPCGNMIEKENNMENKLISA